MAVDNPDSLFATWGADGLTTLSGDAPAAQPDLAEEGLLGRGGMGSVHRVVDKALARTVAMKVIRPGPSPQSVARFVAEARLAARLDHPGIVPIHQVGELADGRPWFTMKEITGRTLAAVLDDVHRASVAASSWVEVDGWSQRRLVDALQRAAEAVACAHDAHVVHRDLKPENIMVGPYGEVYVLDWGIAKVLGAADPEGDELTVFDEATDDGGLTNYGDILGTPAYLAPEQAMGVPELLGPASDVYGLGAILFEILAGRPPHQGQTMELIARLLDPDMVVDLSPLDAIAPADPTLRALCEAALQRNPADRPADAGAFALRLREWLDGKASTDRALRHVARFDAMAPRPDALRAQAAELTAKAQALLEGSKGWHPETTRHEGWALEDQARALRNEAASVEQQAEEELAVALSLSPLLAPAHARLAECCRLRQAQAESTGDEEAAARQQARMRRHVGALPSHHPDRARLEAWTRGHGRLQLDTSVPARVTAFPQVLRQRRLVDGPPVELGTTPIDCPIAHGSWRLVLQASDRTPLVVPIAVERTEHVQQTVALPANLPPGCSYVPPGWFWAGHPDGDLPEQRVWCDAFVIGRTPVTIDEYCVFLAALVDRGDEDDAKRFTPKTPGSRHGDGPDLLPRDHHGHWRAGVDPDGDRIEGDWPAMCVDWYGAQAYAAWRAQTTGLPWRLPAELEWEKAARGVDGRDYPWGPHADPTWANGRDSSPRSHPASVHDFPVDTSPYGVRHLGANCRDWTGDLYRREGPPLDDQRVVPPPPPRELADGMMVVGRGGGWPLTLDKAQSWRRVADRPDYRHPAVSFRLVCPWPM